MQKYEVMIRVIIRVKILLAKGVNPNLDPEIETGSLSGDSN